jgi:hypothetical protein
VTCGYLSIETIKVGAAGTLNLVTVHSIFRKRHVVLVDGAKLMWPLSREVIVLHKERICVVFASETDQSESRLDTSKMCEVGSTPTDRPSTYPIGHPGV